MKLANDIPKLAKFYADKVVSANEMQQEEKLLELLKFMNEMHRELRVRGNILWKHADIPVKWTKKNNEILMSQLDSNCPGRMESCPDGTCVPIGSSCGLEL